MSSTSAVTRDGLTLHGAPDEPLLVHFDQQYIWSFTPSRDGSYDGTGEASLTRVSWPRALRPYLKGSTHVRVATFSGDAVAFDAEVAFTDAGSRVDFTDDEGAPYSIDKVGHLTRAFAETSPAVKAELLEATQLVLRELRDRCGVEAYLCYGALLGAVRQGTMLGHDSDVDVCYYSAHSTPVDIIAESYRIQRRLRELDWNVLRMSAGDTKVIWPLSDGRVAHIDIFAAFTIPAAGGDVFYQFGNRNGTFDVAENLLPLGTIDLEGVTFPAPKHPEAMLSFIYGPSWRVPDPGFRYQDNPRGTRRLDGWFRGFRTEVPLWGPIYSPHGAEKIPTGASTFATWVAERIGAEDKIVDLGAGTGRDAFAFGAMGHEVLAMDYSRPAIGLMRRRQKALLASADPAERRVGELVTPELIVLNEARLVMSLIVALSLDPHHLYGRGLIGSLDEEARRHLFRIAAGTLRGEHRMFLEFSALVDGVDHSEPQPRGLTRRFDPAWLAGEIEEFGGIVEHLEVGPGLDMYDDPDPAVARMIVSFPRGSQQPQAS